MIESLLTCRRRLLPAALLIASVGLAGAAGRDQIRIVGSSTVYPFSAKVAEQFGRTTRFKTPIVESTGSGGGIKLFCAGVGPQTPDIANSSRAIKPSEVEQCRAHGVDSITEVQIGYDGIVLASSKKASPFPLTRRAIFLALAKMVPDGKGGVRPNPHRRWNEIDPSLPAVAIEVLGPPPTSGTRDAFVELAMEGGCKTFEEIAALAATDRSRFKEICHGIREDGAFVEAGENDNLIVQKIVANPDALGVFGFSFLDQNRDKIFGHPVDGVEPTFESIADGSYPISRPLFFYVKNAHAEVIPGIREFVREFTSEKAIGDEGYLTDLGLIPMPRELRARVRAAALALEDNVASHRGID